MMSFKLLFVSIKFIYNKGLETIQQSEPWFHDLFDVCITEIKLKAIKDFFFYLLGDYCNKLEAAKKPQHLSLDNWLQWSLMFGKAAGIRPARIKKPTKTLEPRRSNL